jgi:hypothetical protein
MRKWPTGSPFDHRKTRKPTRRFCTTIHPLLYNKRNRQAITISGDIDGPIKKTDEMWVPVAVAALLFECSHQTIRILWSDGKIRSVKYPSVPLLVYLPDILFYEWDEDDQARMDET